MKIFNVSIDNNPGGWKSGSDPSILVLAKNKKDAIEKVKGGWGENWKYVDGEHVYIYGPECDKSWINDNSVFSASEIKFELPGYTVEIKNIRKEKLNKINKI